MSTQQENVFNTSIGANLMHVAKKPEPILTLGQMFKIKREKLNLSVTLASKKMGVTFATLAKIEKIRDLKYVHAITLKKFIDFYGITQADLDMVIGKPSLKQISSKYPLNQIEARNRLSMELSKSESNTLNEIILPKDFIIKPPITIANILKDLKSYFGEMNGIDKKGLLFENLKKTSVHHVQRAMALLEDIELFDTFIIASRQDKPES